MFTVFATESLPNKVALYAAIMTKMNVNFSCELLSVHKRTFLGYSLEALMILI